MSRTVTAAAHLRTRNQVTIPDPIVRAAGFEPGETFVVELDPAEPDTIRWHRVRTSYAGALRGLWGGDAAAWLAAERDAWE
ncbi:MAG: hypothetical protein ACYDAK_02745 [Candidatus Limnocylindrales bacterium]